MLAPAFLISGFFLGTGVFGFTNSGSGVFSDFESVADALLLSLLDLNQILTSLITYDNHISSAITGTNSDIYFLLTKISIFFLKCRKSR